MRAKGLTPNPRNPRSITDAKLAQLKAAMLEFGDLSGIVFNRKSGQLVGGHQRSASLDEDSEVVITKKYAKPTRTGTVAEGYVILQGERWNYREVSWGQHKETAANIAANKNAGEWDSEALTAQLKELGSFDVDFDLGLTMFDPEELRNLGIGDIIVSGHTRIGVGGVDEDEIPEKPPARTKPGNIFQLGTHRLICGDSRDLSIVQAVMDGSQAQMVWTDPPYNVALGMETVAQAKARNRRIDGLTVMNDKMTDEAFREFLTSVFSSMADITVPGGAFYVAHADSEGYNFRGAARDAGWLVKQCLIWKKSSLVMGRQDFHWIHEPILYGWKPGASHSWYNDRKQTTVLEFAKPSRSTSHPTMKPVELVEYCIGNNTRVGEIVFDAFGGSGTTLIACEKLERKCRMVELDPSYCDVIVDRWEKYTGGKAKLLNAAAKTKLRKAPVEQASSRAHA